MVRFHSLTVTDVRHDTRDAVVVTLKPQDGDGGAFDFIQGQYLTFRRDFDGEELRRCYSICAGKDDGLLRVGIKRVEGGAFSNWANDELKPGMSMEAMPPMGRFHMPIEPEAARHYLMFAGGSGITPVLSIVKTVLAREPKSRVTLLYANRAVNTIMFRDELADLKDRYLDRLTVLHVLENDAQEIELFTGRIDARKVEAFFTHWIDPRSVDAVFICGPEPMMLAIAEALKAHGIAEDRIRFELFANANEGRLKRQVVSAARSGENAGTIAATVILDGAAHSFSMTRGGERLLDAALAAHVDAPYACKAGVCSTCRARVLEGEAEMLSNNALEDHEVRDGYVLTCQCIPLSETIVVSYDV